MYRYSLTSFSKSHLIAIVILSIIGINQIIEIQQKTFQCENNWKLFFTSRFSRIDCTNPYLHQLEKQKIETNVCTRFNPLYSRVITDLRSFKPFQMSDFPDLQHPHPSLSYNRIDRTSLCFCLVF